VTTAGKVAANLCKAKVAEWPLELARRTQCLADAKAALPWRSCLDGAVLPALLWRSLYSSAVRGSSKGGEKLSRWNLQKASSELWRLMAPLTERPVCVERHAELGPEVAGEEPPGQS